jgi:hypothetical protein
VAEHDGEPAGPGQDPAPGNGRPRLRELLILVLAGLGLRRAYRRQTDGESETRWVMLNDRSRLLRNRALDLALDHRVDRAAVQEIARLARGKNRDLMVAAKSLRQGCVHEDDWVANRAHRLLQAAAAGSGVETVADDLSARLDRFEQLAALPLEARFAQLVELEPRLGALEEQVRAGQLGHLPPRPEVAQAAEDHDIAKLLAARSVTQALEARLERLVGPHAENDHILLRSQRGGQWAAEHLGRLMGEETPPPDGGGRARDLR